MENFFIVGCPRSGTTVLQQALNRHPGIVIPPETKFFFSFYGLSPRRQRIQLRRLNRDLGVDLALPDRGVRTPSEAREFFDRMARAYLARRGHHDAQCFGEKTPEHTSRLRLIREVFPEAKMLFIYRDGRDVALSLSKMPWMVPDPCACFCVWLYYYRFLRLVRAADAANVLCVRYENVVRQPVHQFTEILRFLGVADWREVALGFGNREGIPDREMPWKEGALWPISAERVGRWREELPAEDIAVMECLGRKPLQDLGYLLETGGGRRPPFARLVKTAYSLARFAARIPRYAAGRELLSWAIDRWPATTRTAAPGPQYLLQAADRAKPGARGRGSDEEWVMPSPVQVPDV